MAINPSRATLNKHIYLTYLFKLHTMKHVFLIYQFQRRFKLQKSRKGEEEREPARMAKAFDFQMLIIYDMFKSTIWVISTTTTAYFKYITQLCKIRKSANSSNIDSQSDPVYLK